jgi:glucosyl-3-phosphoglycerate synthase
MLPAPDPRLRAVVVVPAHNEEQRITGCIRALADQTALPAAAYEVLLVLDRCSDRTRERGVLAAGSQLRLGVIECSVAGAGGTRRTGMELACERLLAVGRPRGLIASTDADSVVALDWLSVQLALVDAGARAIGGEVELDSVEAARLPAQALTARDEQARVRMERLGASPGAEHHFFSGASLAMTPEAYREIGGMPERAALEDESLQQTLESRGIPILRPRSVRVRTSARIDGRAQRGLARDLALADWRARRSFRADQFSLADLVERKDATVSLVIPTREVAATIGQIVGTAERLRIAGLLDEVLVVDAESGDGTAEIAAAAGATIVQEDEILTAFGAARGKGDAMWRGLSVSSGEIVVYVDGDTEDFNPRFVIGLLGPLITRPEVAYVKGAFRRPLRTGDETLPYGGGRVTELVARPLLNLYAPELAGFDQPLAGELAGRRDLLERLPFSAGYGVEIAQLLDAARAVGLEGLAQVDLGTRQNRHQPLRDLSAMAYAVIVAAASRLSGLQLALTPGPLALPPVDYDHAMEIRQVVVDERPPLSTLARTQS